ncbi:hypothetical protein SAMN05428969_0073 [Devosia sp. YR412]|uniref:hypothetical protein n=1 Tax=Devosia sp. YR412 TaxID=1881030 RepID=UPI0008BCFCF2|nr:hypothetical protein [Devosia sp. YR412]SEP60268.1 hypothetical protein SAMN05428969_0073 [Devosia sp. YR412]
MIRSLAALATLALLTGSVIAQEAVAPPAASDIVIDPAATLNTSPKQANMLTGFYATQAVIELCSVSVEPDVLEGMAADRTRLETALSMDAAASASAYAQVKADVEKTTPDCTDGSTDRISVDAVTAIYKAQSAAAPADPATAATPAVPAAAATPAAPATPAVPAQ